MLEQPRLTAESARVLVKRLYGLDARLTPFPSERDQNFRIDVTSTERYVLKIANASESFLLEAQNAVLSHLAKATSICPRPVPAKDGLLITGVPGPDGKPYVIRLLTYLDGIPLERIEEKSPELLFDLGKVLGQLDRALEGFDHPAFHREFHWDLSQGLDVVQKYAPLIEDVQVRTLVHQLASEIEKHTVGRLGSLRRSVIHNDANDHNVIVGREADTQTIVGLIDFGDMVHSYTVGDLAIGAAYAVLDTPDPLDVIGEVTRGYDSENRLSLDEIGALYGLICLRLCTSACIAARQVPERPDDPYLGVSQEPIQKALPKLAERPFTLAEEVLRDACGITPSPGRTCYARTTGTRDGSRPLERRRMRVGRNLSLSYSSPIHLSRGWMQYLFDLDGRRYLDAYNNVPHVGHSHPRVVAAATRQMRRLNTNTRYLYGALSEYAERLASTLPDPLSVCFFLNSASEANELALRLARAHTGGTDLIVLESAYHGHTTSLIDISPYKHDGPGGQGAPSWVHVVPVPDLYRGRHRRDDPLAAAKYASYVHDAAHRIQEEGRQLSGFIAETCPSVAGQLLLPEGYFVEVYRHVRDAGGLCIADEVQTGYGRLGTSFYAFETHDVFPDIVVLGKPIGNGHPVAAVVTTPEIADSFDNGMEFFSTFGGNTVSCEVGLTVLDIVQEDQLQEHAARVGRRLLGGFHELADKYPLVGDVRGSGLFLGVEMVRDRESREPAREEASAVVNLMREAGVLIGTDGPHDNVLKVRPPMPFDESNADVLVRELDRALRDRSESR
jgi:4-aminobutyrate aminotransferase-like enzyme/Ser/Thr protein kinase RdoA (MazF antagonist)